ncbi:hypothetical protein Dimus_037689 [Dionaea muscipula]
MMPEDLPDELWRRIMEVGVQGSSLTYKDLCCLSISCRRLRRLSDEDSLWSYLLSSDFSPTAAANPLSASSSSSSSTIGSSSSRASSPKILYRIRFLLTFLFRFQFLVSNRCLFRKSIW